MVLIVVLFAAASLGPPVWLIAALARRLQRTRARGANARWIAAALLLTSGILVFELAVALPTSAALLRGTADLGAVHASALLLAWLCLWVRVALKKMRRFGGGGRAY